MCNATDSSHCIYFVIPYGRTAWVRKIETTWRQEISWYEIHDFKNGLPVVEFPGPQNSCIHDLSRGYAVKWCMHVILVHVLVNIGGSKNNSSSCEQTLFRCISYLLSIVTSYTVFPFSYPYNLFIVLIAGLIGVTGLPCLFMARKFGNAQPAIQADVAAPRRLT